MRMPGLTLMFAVFWSMSDKLNIAIIGCAEIADTAIIPAIKLMSEHYNLVGIASRSKEKSFKFAEKFNTKAYHLYESILDIDGLDAVYIPLPNSLHYEWAAKCLKRGLNVLVEKSMACNFEDVEMLNKMAAKKNLALVENFQFRFHSQLKFIQKIVDGGKVGELRSIKSSFGFPPFKDPENIRYKKNLGGGSLLDAGVYPLKILQVFMGFSIEVLASKLHILNDLDIWGSAYIGSKNSDLVGHITFGFDNHYQCELEIVGSLGRIYTNRIFTAPPDYNPIVELHTLKDGYQKFKLEADNHFRNMLLHFKNLVVSKVNLSDEYDQNINHAELIDQLQKTSQSF
jgi:NDP-hexose-3-ketoreductase